MEFNCSAEDYLEEDSKHSAQTLVKFEILDLDYPDDNVVDIKDVAIKTEISEDETDFNIIEDENQIKSEVCTNTIVSVESLNAGGTEENEMESKECDRNLAPLLPPLSRPSLLFATSPAQNAVNAFLPKNDIILAMELDKHSIRGSCDEISETLSQDQRWHTMEVKAKEFKLNRKVNLSGDVQNNKKNIVSECKSMNPQDPAEKARQRKLALQLLGNEWSERIPARKRLNFFLNKCIDHHILKMESAKTEIINSKLPIEKNKTVENTISDVCTEKKKHGKRISDISLILGISKSQESKRLRTIEKARMRKIALKQLASQFNEKPPVTRPR